MFNIFGRRKGKIKHMDFKDIESLGYKIKDNYIFNEKDTDFYKIRIVFPYSIDNEDLLVFPYIGILTGIIQNYFTFACDISYQIGPTFSIISIDTYTLKNVSIALGTVFNFLDSVDIDKFFVDDDGKSSLIYTDTGDTLITRFMDEARTLYNEGRFHSIRVNGISISDYMAYEYMRISTNGENYIKERLEYTKSLLKEDKVLVFVEGRNVSHINFKTHKNGFNTNTPEIVENIHYDKEEVWYGSTRKKYENYNQCKEELIEDLFIYKYIGFLLDKVYYIEYNIRAILGVYMIPVSPKKIEEQKTETSQGVLDILYSGNHNIEFFLQYKSDFIKSIISEFGSDKYDIDKVIDKILMDKPFFSTYDVHKFIEKVDEYSFDDMTEKCRVILSKMIKDKKTCDN